MTEKNLYSIEKVSEQELIEIHDSLPEDLLIPFDQAPQFQHASDGSPVRSPYGFFVFRDGEELIATLSVYRFTRRIRTSVVSLMGPVFVAERTPVSERRLVDTFLDYLREDPSIDPLYARLHLQFPSVIDGAQHSIERGGFEREVVVRFGEDRSPEAIKKSFSSNARNRINKSVRAGVEVREITENRSQVFEDVCFPIMEETASRDEFALQPLQMYKSVLDDLSEFTGLYVAYAPASDADEDKDNLIPVAWMITSNYHHRGCYWFGASNHRAQQTHAMFALMYRILCELAAQGCREVGLTGIKSPRFPEFRSLEDFKMRFSKETLDYPQLFDVPLNKPKYRAVRALIIARTEGPVLARKAAANAKKAPALAKRAPELTKRAPELAKKAQAAVKERLGK